MVYTPAADDERVVPLDLGVTPDPNAPMPVLLRGSRTFLCFYTMPVGGEDTMSSEIAVVEWMRCRVAVLGPPNDEAISGHRLWHRGMDAVPSGPLWADCMEVVKSQWIASMEQANRVHPQHHPSLFADDRHFIVLFKDETFECVAQSYTVERARDDMASILKKLAAQVA